MTQKAFHFLFCISKIILMTLHLALKMININSASSFQIANNTT